MRRCVQIFLFKTKRRKERAGEGRILKIRKTEGQAHWSFTLHIIMSPIKAILCWCATPNFRKLKLLNSFLPSLIVWLQNLGFRSKRIWESYHCFWYITWLVDSCSVWLKVFLIAFQWKDLLIAAFLPSCISSWQPDTWMRLSGYEGNSSHFSAKPEFWPQLREMEVSVAGPYICSFSHMLIWLHSF